MARQKSKEKRAAILNAATHIIVKQGLSAPTATIAQEASISNGSLFTYFETKTDLFNQLYLELKSDMISSAMDDFPETGSLRQQVLQVWSNWVEWALSNPEKKRALEQLRICDDITPETRAIADKKFAVMGDLIEKIRQAGPLKDAPFSFTGALMNSLADITMDFMIKDPANAKQHSKLGFETFWRAVI